ncbi:hypothetical protein [Streptomyces sp. NPDC005374]|uniref:hypothetical protein n=1 Tax=Streptomyces sp. NPDC005374 TaxID=3364713 RepID=UPI0036D02616
MSRISDEQGRAVDVITAPQPGMTTLIVPTIAEAGSEPASATDEHLMTVANRRKD